MSNPRLQLALEQIQAGNWHDFELFAAEFLAIEFPQLRTTAAPNGDGGRDGELFVTGADPTTAFQYSVTESWKPKIKNTVEDLKRNFPKVKRIVYATNQEIGPAADDLRADMWSNKGVQIDIRDSSWFVDRELTHAQRQVASQELIRKYADPLLATRGVTARVGAALTGEESRLAILHLTLDRQDQAGDKNLTKSCFEALVLAALHDTSAENRMQLQEVQDRITSYVPAGAEGQTVALVKGALERLSRKRGPVKHNVRLGGYHLSFDESRLLHDRTAQYILDEEALEADLSASCYGLIDELDENDEKRCIVAHKLKHALELLLLRRGELFANAVESGAEFQIDISTIESELIEAQVDLGMSPRQAAKAITALLGGPSDESRAHLTRLVEAYTLFAFLKQTPDVQKVMLKVFAEGDIWLDTSAILPVLAELLLEDQAKPMTILFRAAVDAGLNLYITNGVAEEIESHLHRCCRAATLGDEWSGNLPYIFSSYVLSGRDPADFVEWQKDIRGDMRPVEDVAEYLNDTFLIKRKNLEDEAANAPLALRAAVQEMWYEVHDRRRNLGHYDVDPDTVARLVNHDVENMVGIIQLRKNSASDPLGYRHWWLTLDSRAHSAKAFLRDRLGDDAPPSPVLNPDFLAQLLRLGPLRTAVEQANYDLIPSFTDVRRIEHLPQELLEAAHETRAQFSGMSERRIQREVRDKLDKLRSSSRGESTTISPTQPSSDEALRFQDRL